ncbi:hypothetical protein [Phenylobacterium sp.]|uniref:hypothetical protein n=1 Tax=Phenylobacterium sp. TaxID=1871053 RepID=UPI0035691658
MILAALTLAGALTIAAPAVKVPPPIAERTPNLYRQPAHCRSVVEQEVGRQTVALGGRARGSVREGMQYAVHRQLDGCSVPTPIGYHPAVAPGAADVPPPPVTREDGPWNRR